MSNTPPTTEVRHNAERFEIYIDLPGGQRAFVGYRLLDGHKIDFYRAFVLSSACGHWLAAVIVERALDWAGQQGFEIKASCWYAANKIAERNKG